jgi:phosphoglycerate dehydrogenase-like enzyme
VSCWTFSEADEQTFRESFPGVEPVVCRHTAEFVEALPEAALAIVWRFDQDWFDKAPRLRVVATPAAGRDYFHVTPPAHVTVLHGQFHGILMGETVAGALLAMSRGLLPAATTFAADPWPRAALGQCMRPLRGSRVTILGFGNIGTWIGRLLKGFGVHITGVRRHAGCPGPDYFDSDDRVAPVAELDTILAATDHLVLALPGGGETDGILDGRRLALLPSHATLCNVGRGNAIDERALANALRSGRLAGAVLDVFSHEPLPADTPLRRTPNLWCLPHAAAIAPNYIALFLADLARQLRPLLPLSPTG